VKYRGWNTAGVSGVTMLGLLLAGCAQTPMGPTVQVMPGPGKSFEAFQYDQMSCKQFAEQSVAGQAQSANNQAVGAAVLTTALGAGLGAATGSAWRHGAGTGAAIGAGAGAATGAAIGSSMSANAQMGIQGQYDNAFAQCMYSKGEMVPGYDGGMMVNAPVSYGSDAGLTRAVQAQLIRLGILRGVADGVMGPQTSNAISQFESGSGLPVDGMPSPQLLARLQSTP